MSKPNKLLLASGNKHKFTELCAKLNVFSDLRILLPDNFGVTLEVDEDGDSLEENAKKKALAYFNLFKIPALADDTGLFVNALGGLPGVRSARYAGDDSSYSDNRKKLLDELAESKDRSAEFRTVLCLVLSESEFPFFEGRCKGKITETEMGEGGFGYDAIFVPEGFEQTFAQMSDVEKNRISHRGIALDSLTDFLSSKFFSTP